MSENLVRRRRANALDPHSDAFRHLSDVLLAGAFVFIAGVLVVTWFTALAAAASVLITARTQDRSVRTRDLWREFSRRCRKRWVSHLVVPTFLGLLIVTDALVLPLMLGDTTIALVLVWLGAALALTVGLLYALRGREDAAARANWQRTSAAAQSAPGAVALLGGAAMTALAVTALAPLLIFVMAGPLAFAAAAVSIRIDASGSPASSRS